MQIRLEDDELILQKLSKLKCDKKGCQTVANYIIFEIGIFCTSCFAKEPEVAAGHFATFEDLSKMITELTKNYQQSKKDGTHLLALKNEVVKHRKVIEDCRDAVVTEAKSIRSKSQQIVSRSEEKCMKEWKNQALEDIFEPSLTASVVEESRMLLKYLDYLQVIEGENGKYEYVFNQPGKNPQKAKNEAIETIERIELAIDEAQDKSQRVMEAFRRSIKE